MGGGNHGDDGGNGGGGSGGGGSSGGSRFPRYDDPPPFTHQGQQYESRSTFNWAGDQSFGPGQAFSSHNLYSPDSSGGNQNLIAKTSALYDPQSGHVHKTSHGDSRESTGYFTSVFNLFAKR